MRRKYFRRAVIAAGGRRRFPVWTSFFGRTAPPSPERVHPCDGPIGPGTSAGSRPREEIVGGRHAADHTYTATMTSVSAGGAGGRGVFWLALLLTLLLSVGPPPRTTTVAATAATPTTAFRWRPQRFAVRDAIDAEQDEQLLDNEITDDYAKPLPPPPPPQIAPVDYVPDYTSDYSSTLYS